MFGDSSWHTRVTHGTRMALGLRGKGHLVKAQGALRFPPAKEKKWRPEGPLIA
jgi:hypothetical protein